jgi:serine/threonine-protein kinase
MARCPNCSREAPHDSRFCPACGTSFASAASAATRTSVPNEMPTAASGVVSHPSLDQSRFLPGAMLDGRYRLHGLLGRGGMGEVYRADDLKLGQQVALKFLPRELDDDRGRLNRFLNEVKLARQVSHPNVCRVYDVGETGGQHYLSMEYVDGEDLASLLRRIGRLPKDKAAQIARQICAGLAAAHEQGILHRDLKPANVMIDGQGRAKITDFGLAGLEEAIAGADVQSGTPAYMAPEQISGKEVTVKSDIYSLGLLLYEIFTGKRAFEAATLAELRRAQTETTPTSPSSLVEGMDPAAERVILRCIEKPPAGRPESALAVAAALPGGDPLAAALAAGETPSPEVVAEAGGEGGLLPAVALGCLAFVLVATVALAALSERTSMLGYVSLDKPPQVLSDRASQILAEIGYDEAPVDTAYHFDYEREYVRHVRENDESADRWAVLATNQPPVYVFDYRASPRLLVPRGPNGSVSGTDPPPFVSGMIRIQLGPEGRLRDLSVVPPQVDAASDEPPPELDWSLLLVAAGYDTAELTPVESTWPPYHHADARAAWTGVYPDNPGVEVRLEAAAYRGKPISFQTIEPWTRPSRMQPYEQTRGEKAGQVVALSLFIGIMIGASVLARRNLRVGRGDRRGAFRIAAVVLTVLTINWLLTAHHVPDLESELYMIIVSLGMSLFIVGLVWLMYVALEPFVRRRWPDTLVSWNRLLAGRLKDPLVGRDILIGSVISLAMDLFGNLVHSAKGWLSLPPPEPTQFAVGALLGGRHLVGQVFDSGLGAVIVPVGVLFLLVILRVVLRQPWLATAAFVLLFATLGGLQSDTPAIDGVLGLVVGSVFVFMLVRFGLVTFAAASFTGSMRSTCPLTLDLSTWYASASIVCTGAVIAITLYAFYTSLAGRPIFGEALAES